MIDDSVESQFLSVSFRLNDQTIRANLSEELSMGHRDNPEVINDHMNKLPARVAFWGAVLAEAEYVAEKIRDQFDQWYAMQADLALQSLKVGKPPSYQPTKDAILAQILVADKEAYDDYAERLRKAEKDVRVLRRSFRAFEIRAEMLINIGATIRTQLKNTELTTPDDDEFVRRK